MPAPNKESKYTQMMSQFRAYIITEELKKHKWCISKTARSFGIHRNSLSRLIDGLGIEIKREVKNDNRARNTVGRGSESVGVIPTNEANPERSLSANQGSS